MNATPEMKLFSILLAWEYDNHEAGEFGWFGRAPDFATAVEMARTEGARSNNGYADECENCGCTDNDGSDICPDCGGKITDPADLDQYKPSDHVLDSMEGCNMWAAPEMLAALKAALPILSWAAHRWSDAEKPKELVAAAIARAEGVET